MTKDMTSSDNYILGVATARGSLPDNNEPECGPIDLSYLKSFSAGDKEFEKDMLQSSVTDIDKKMAELKKGFIRNKPVLIKIASHSLKSLCSITGFATLVSIIDHIEKDCENVLVAQYVAAEKVWKKGRLVLTQMIRDLYE